MNLKFTDNFNEPYRELTIIAAVAVSSGSGSGSGSCSGSGSGSGSSEKTFSSEKPSTFMNEVR